MEEIEISGMQTVDARFDISPPSVQVQFENEEKESFMKTFMDHNKVNVDRDALKMLLLDVYKDTKGDWYLKDKVSSKSC